MRMFLYEESYRDIFAPILISTYNVGTVCKAMDPDSLNPDPHPAFKLNPDPDQIRIQSFDDQKLNKKITQKFLIFFKINNCNLLMSKLQG